MDALTFTSLCDASQLSFAGADKDSFIQSLDRMIDFFGIVKNYDAGCVYEPVAVGLNDLRNDAALPSYPAESLLQNTEPLFDCYVIPKIME